MQKIVISNRKGGVGKTTTSINLAAGLAKLGKRVLLIDLDTQSHLQVGLGYKKPFKRGVHTSLLKGKVKESIYETKFDNLSLMPADIAFEISKLGDDTKRLKRIISKVEDRFDITIIDTSPSLDILLLNALEVGDYAIVPMQVEYLSYMGVMQFLKLFYKTATSVNSKIKLLGIVPTMYNKSLKDHNEILNELKSVIGEKRVFDPIRKDAKVSDSFRHGKPVIYYDGRCRASKDYKQLVFSVIEKI